MKHLARIQVEFLKEARKWDDMRLEEQKNYLKQHPKSKRKITARDPETDPEFLAIKEKNDKDLAFRNSPEQLAKYNKKIQNLIDSRRETIDPEWQNPTVTKETFNRLNHLAEHNQDRDKLVKSLAKEVKSNYGRDANGGDLNDDVLRSELNLPDEGKNKEIDKWIEKELEHFQDDVDSVLSGGAA